MDPKSAKSFGCFLGVLFALLALQIINAIFDLSLNLEYIVFVVSALVFGIIGMIFASFIAKRSAKSKPANKQVPPKDIPANETTKHKKQQETLNNRT